MCSTRSFSDNPLDDTVRTQMDARCCYLRVRDALHGVVHFLQILQEAVSTHPRNGFNCSSLLVSSSFLQPALTTAVSSHQTRIENSQVTCQMHDTTSILLRQRVQLSTAYGMHSKGASPSPSPSISTTQHMVCTDPHPHPLLSPQHSIWYVQ